MNFTTCTKFPSGQGPDFEVYGHDYYECVPPMKVNATKPKVQAKRFYRLIAVTLVLNFTNYHFVYVHKGTKDEPRGGSVIHVTCWRRSGRGNIYSYYQRLRHARWAGGYDVTVDPADKERLKLDVTMAVMKYIDANPGLLPDKRMRAFGDSWVDHTVPEGKQ